MKKIVVNVIDYTDHIDFELFCFEYDFVKTKIVERCVFKLTDENIETIKQELLVKLAELEFNKASCVVGIYSPYFFTETLTMPKLTVVEENKATNLKLDKLYKEFDKAYYSVRDKYVYNKTTRRHLIHVIRKSVYNKIIQKLSELPLSIEKVVFNPMALANYIGQKHIFSKDKIGLFINFERTSTSIVIVKGTSLIDYKVLDNGIMTLYEVLTGKKDKELEEMVTSEAKIEVTNPSKIVKDFISKLENEIKNMSYLADGSINEFYLHSEYEIDKTLKSIFEKSLQVTFKPSIKAITQNSVGIQAFSLLRYGYLSNMIPGFTRLPEFPVKVK